MVQCRNNHRLPVISLRSFVRLCYVFKVTMSVYYRNLFEERGCHLPVVYNVVKCCSLPSAMSNVLKIIPIFVESTPLGNGIPWNQIQPEPSLVGHFMAVLLMKMVHHKRKRSPLVSQAGSWLEGRVFKSRNNSYIKRYKVAFIPSRSVFFFVSCSKQVLLTTVSDSWRIWELSSSMV